MIRTAVSILVTLALIITLSFFEIRYVQNTFSYFGEVLEALFKKTEAHTANYQDGEAVRTFWEEKRQTLHVWLPHTAIQEIDLQLSEAIGYLYQENYEDSLAKIEVLIGTAKHVPDSYTLNLKNIF